MLQQESQLESDSDLKRQSLAAAVEQFERIQQEFLSQNSNYQAIQAEVQALEGSNDQQRSELLECVSLESAQTNQLQQLDDLDVRLENQLKRLYQERDETAALRMRLRRNKKPPISSNKGRPGSWRNANSRFPISREHSRI